MGYQLPLGTFDHYPVVFLKIIQVSVFILALTLHRITLKAQEGYFFMQRPLKTYIPHQNTLGNILLDTTFFDSLILILLVGNF